MIYGPNTKYVQEVIDFLKAGRLLRDPHPPTSTTITTIRSLAEREPYRQSPADTPDEMAWNWSDIKQAAGTDSTVIEAEVWSQLGDEMCNALGRKWDEMYDVVKQQLEGTLEEHDIQEILGDHEWIAMYRAAFGPTNAFFEQMFTMYRLGGYPCGWDGPYPLGRMVVYFPPDEST